MTSGLTPDGPESPNPDPDREIRFFENPDFSFFRLFKLKTPCNMGVYGLPWTQLGRQYRYHGTAVLFRYCGSVIKLSLVVRSAVVRSTRRCISST